MTLQHRIFVVLKVINTTSASNSFLGARRCRCLSWSCTARDNDCRRVLVSVHGEVDDNLEDVHIWKGMFGVSEFTSSYILSSVCSSISDIVKILIFGIREVINTTSASNSLLGARRCWCFSWFCTTRGIDCQHFIASDCSSGDGIEQMYTEETMNV